jgi:hypothetical protein
MQFLKSVFVLVFLKHWAMGKVLGQCAFYVSPYRTEVWAAKQTGYQYVDIINVNV